MSWNHLACQEQNRILLQGLYGLCTHLGKLGFFLVFFFFRPGKFRKAMDNERKIHLFTLKPVPDLVQTGASSTTAGKSYHPSNHIVYIRHKT